jgi:PPOX class probable F420-dependent enzyme
MPASPPTRPGTADADVMTETHEERGASPMSSDATTTPTSATTQQPMTRDAIDAFLQQPLVAVLSWVSPKGDVASSPVWYEYRDGKIWVASSSAFAKVRAMAKNPRVSVCIQDPDPPYRYVTMRATAKIHADPKAALALDTKLAHRYLGRIAAKYYLDAMAASYPGESRLIELTPTRFSSMDGSSGINPLLLVAMKALRTVGL